MNISSQAFGDNQLIPAKYTCEGSNASPPLMFSSIPVHTVSLSLIVDDPDAPSGTFTHWVLYNISPNTTSLPESGVPSDTMQGSNSAGHAHYDGPCPPSGTHRYIFRLYAVDKPLDLSYGASRQSVESAMHGHILDRAELTGLYQKTGA